MYEHISKCSHCSTLVLFITWHKSGDTDDVSEDTGDVSGDTDGVSGDTDDVSGDTDDVSGDTDDVSGDTYDGMGYTYSSSCACLIFANCARDAQGSGSAL